MKARLLIKLLNDTKYCVNNNDEYIAVGSPLCHKLISVNKKTLELKYALDTFHEGRAALAKEHQKELLFIYDKLQELIDNGQIKDIIEGVDEIENPLPVYTVEDGELISTFTDAYGYPHTTINGDVMHDNTHFKEKIKAIEYGINEAKCGVTQYTRILKEREEKAQEAKEWLETEQGYVIHLEALKKSL